MTFSVVKAELSEEKLRMAGVGVAESPSGARPEELRPRVEAELLLELVIFFV